MLEWFLEWFNNISEQVKILPAYFSAPVMILVGALDSSLLSLPEVNDYITAYRVAHNPSEVYYFPLFPAIGSVIGCLVFVVISGRAARRTVGHHTLSSQTPGWGKRDLPQVGSVGAGHPGVAPTADAFQDFRGGGGRVELSGRSFCYCHNDCAIGALL